MFFLQFTQVYLNGQYKQPDPHFYILIVTTGKDVACSAVYSVPGLSFLTDNFPVLFLFLNTDNRNIFLTMLMWYFVHTNIIKSVADSKLFS